MKVNLQVLAKKEKLIELKEEYVCEIKISPSRKPVFINKEFYIRNGTQAVTLKAEELFDLMKKRRDFKYLSVFTMSVMNQNYPEININL